MSGGCREEGRSSKGWIDTKTAERRTGTWGVGSETSCFPWASNHCVSKQFCKDTGRRKSPAGK